MSPGLVRYILLAPATAEEGRRATRAVCCSYSFRYVSLLQYPCLLICCVVLVSANAWIDCLLSALSLQSWHGF